MPRDDDEGRVPEATNKAPQSEAKPVGDAKPAPAPPAPPPAPPRRSRGSGRAIRYLAIASVAIAAIVFGTREVMNRMTHVYEYDARVVTDHITIGARVDGNLTSLLVETGDRVRAGDVMAQIDDRVVRLELEALRAELVALQAERQEFAARTDLVTRQTDSRYRTRLTSIRGQQARRAALVAELTLARQDLERFRSLFQRRVIARASLDKAEAEVTRLQSDVHQADANIASSRGEADEAEADKGELVVIESELAILNAQESQLAARVARQEALIAWRAIRAPRDGVVDRVFVENGEYVGEGRRVMMLHDPDDVWVEANIKETEVRRLKLGQRVAVQVDAYPDDVFVGRVAKIGTAATSQFALLPTPNPSGNFTKVTQRIPVKIIFEEKPRELAPGMMVEVEIDISGDPVEG